MDVAALIIEQVEADGLLKRLVMRPAGGHPLTVGFPDEVDETSSGPFFFPDEHDKREFEHIFETCRGVRLSKSSFTAINGKYHLQLHRGGLFTVKGMKSYYSLSLPQFAIPDEINVQDPRADMPLRKNVLRDKERKRFVIYIECMQQDGGFDFLLKVKFRIERAHGKFEIADYRDEHLSRYGQIPYRAFLSSEQMRHMQRFLANKTEDSDASSKITASTATFGGTSQDNGLTEKLRNGQRCNKIIDEIKLIKRAYSARASQSRKSEKCTRSSRYGQSRQTS